MRSRAWSFGVLLLLLVVGLAPNVFANSYTFTTSGCFTPGTCASNGSSIANFGNDATLSFSNIASSTTVGYGSTFSLGSFDLSVLNLGTASYKGTFALAVDFTNPSGTTGNPLVAWVLGGVTYGIGGALITFNSDSQVFNYPGGSFTLDLNSNPILITSWNQPVQINATIVGMPEGSSLVMLGISGLVLFAALVRKSRRSSINGVC